MNVLRLGPCRQLQCLSNAPRLFENDFFFMMESPRLASDGDESDSPVMSREDHIRVYCAPSDPPWIKENLGKFLRGSLPIMVESITNVYHPIYIYIYNHCLLPYNRFDPAFHSSRLKLWKLHPHDHHHPFNFIELIKLSTYIITLDHILICADISFYICVLGKR